MFQVRSLSSVFASDSLVSSRVWLCRSPSSGRQFAPTSPAKRPRSKFRAIQTSSVQSPNPSTEGNKKPEAKTEVAIQDSGTTFRLRVNLVQVHVVRDGKGKPIDNLHKEDFLLYDQGKLQTISTFAVETRETRRARAEAAAKTQVETDSSVETGNPSSSTLPDRFVALSFDDVHMASEDTSFVRAEVNKFLDGLAPTDRVAIYSTSGELSHNFTSDKEALKQAVLGLVPRPKFDHSNSECPDVTPYQADQVENKSNTQVFGVIVQETLQCAFNNDPTQVVAAQAMAQSATQRALTQADIENQFLYSYTEDILRHLAGMPGERVLVMISPGFLLTTQHTDMSAVVDRANRSGIVINTIDARGLYAPDSWATSASDLPIRFLLKATKVRIVSPKPNKPTSSAIWRMAPEELFQNSNDLTAGLHMLGSAPKLPMCQPLRKTQRWTGSSTFEGSPYRQT